MLLLQCRVPCSAVAAKLPDYRRTLNSRCEIVVQWLKPAPAPLYASSPPPGLYNYAKALEELEAGLLGGFFYKHFRWGAPQPLHLLRLLPAATRAAGLPATPRNLHAH